jgi:uncharacterized protein (DUF362 family)
MITFNRRNFLKTSLVGGAAFTLLKSAKAAAPATASAADSGKPAARVSVATANDRADIVFQALKPFAEQIKAAIGNRRVVLKPNNVLIYVPLCATHVETLKGVLEFLKSIDKLSNVIIAESSASGSTLTGFDNYGYNRLLSQYPVKLVDLDAEPSSVMYVTDERDFRPHLIRVSNIILDPNSYVVSVARMKTHTSVGVTLSLKNIVFGAPIKDPGFTLFNEDRRFTDAPVQSKPGTTSHKRPLHGSGYHGVNFNMAMLAQQLHPALAIIDGFEGMEGNGPTLGTPIDHKVCVVSQDWLAADRVAVELMGIDFSKIGYLNNCAQMALGTADLGKIEIVGANLKDHIKSYKLPDNFAELTSWMNPLGAAR